MRFTEERPEWGVGELADVSGLDRPAVSRILAALRRHGFLVQDPTTRRYRLGLALVKLGRVALGCFDLRRVALPLMRELARSTGESVFLTIVTGVEALCLEKVEGPQPVRVSFEVGRHMALHAGASAKLLLAYLPPEQVEQVVASRGLPRFTDRTPTHPDRLLGELEAIRAQGYAFSDGELDEGVAAAAVPVIDGHGDVVASLSIAGPSERVRRQPLTRLLAELDRAARQISEGLRAGTVAQNRRPLPS